MRTSFVLLAVLTVCGCSTPKGESDLLTVYAMRMHELGDVVIVPTPENIPFDDAAPRAAYLEGFADGYRSGRTAISISPFFPADMLHMDAHVKGWYDGQAQGMTESPWKTEFINDQGNTESAPRELTQ